MRTLLFCLPLAFICISSQSLFADDVKVGTKAPDFEATNLEGETVKLSDWFGKEKLVVVFSRAHWCPFCMGQLKDLSSHYKEISEAGAEVIVVFREERDGVAGLRKSQMIGTTKFPLLLDAGAKATPEYSTTGFTTYIIAKDGAVESILAGTKKNRPKAETIIAKVKK